jgi:hypothetical protein
MEGKNSCEDSAAMEGDVEALSTSLGLHRNATDALKQKLQMTIGEESEIASKTVLSIFMSLTRAWVIGGEYQEYRPQRWLSASDCGRLRPAADHPRNAFRVVKAAECPYG